MRPLNQPTGLPRATSRTDRASIVPLIAVMMVTVTGVSITVGRTGRSLIDNARTDAVADSVALAAASGGATAGETVAIANGASVESFMVNDDGSVVVEVSLRGKRSISAAKAD